jgi:DOPA 4,5-dioxygenase
LGQKSISTIKGYHAHIYYDAAGKERAAALRAAIEDKFTVEMGRWRDEPVGPHPSAMYQVAFEVEVFADFVPWLALNRDGLVVLVHPRTGNDIADHSAFAMWLGEKFELDLGVLK